MNFKITDEVLKIVESHWTNGEIEKAIDTLKPGLEYGLRKLGKDNENNGQLFLEWVQVKSDYNKFDAPIEEMMNFIYQQIKFEEHSNIVNLIEIVNYANFIDKSFALNYFFNNTITEVQQRFTYKEVQSHIKRLIEYYNKDLLSFIKLISPDNSFKEFDDSKDQNLSFAVELVIRWGGSDFKWIGSQLFYIVDSLIKSKKFKEAYEIIAGRFDYPIPHKIAFLRIIGKNLNVNEADVLWDCAARLEAFRNQLENREETINMIKPRVSFLTKELFDDPSINQYLKDGLIRKEHKGKIENLDAIELIGFIDKLLDLLKEQFNDSYSEKINQLEELYKTCKAYVPDLHFRNENIFNVYKLYQDSEIIKQKALTGYLREIRSNYTQQLKSSSLSEVEKEILYEDILTEMNQMLITRNELTNYSQEKIKKIEEWYKEEQRFGMDGWQKLNNKSKELLITSELVFNSIKDYKDYVDYSPAILPLTVAFEIELKKYFYEGIINFNSPVQSAMKKPFTLGSVDCYLLDDDYHEIAEVYFPTVFKTIKPYKVLKPERVRYDNKIKKRVMVKQQSGFGCNVEKIRKNYRNIAAHEGGIDKDKATECRDLMLFATQVFVKYIRDIK